MHTQFDKAEEQTLVARYGPTERREVHLELNEIGCAYWRRATVLIRRAEVIMVVQRPDGRLLLHTKGHYPPGTYRLPSGGVQWGESVLDALAREQWEELGLHLPAAAMPGIIRYGLHHDRWTIPFASYLFHLRTTDKATPAAQDPNEAISGFHWVQPADLPAVADHLRTLIRAWGNWGPFRAIAHDVLAEIWEL